VDVLRSVKQFSSRLNFIDNSTLISLAFQLGAKGYISLLGNVTPKAELYLLDLLENGRYGKFDQEYKRLHAWREVLGSAEEMGFQGVGEGTITKAIFEAVGRPIGPPLPPQRRVGKESLEKIKALFRENKVFDAALEVE